jgi:hypothetical protein
MDFPTETEIASTITEKLRVAEQMAEQMSVRISSTESLESVENIKMTSLAQYTGTVFKKPSTVHEKPDIFFIKGTLSYPNGDIFEGYFNDDNIPVYGKYTYNNSVRDHYEGAISNVTKKGPIFEGVGVYTKGETSYCGDWSMNLRHGINIKYVADIPVEGGTYARGNIQSGFKRFDNCMFYGEFVKNTPSPSYGRAVYSEGYVFEGRFSVEPLYKPQNKRHSHAACIEKIIVPVCTNGRLFVNNYETRIVCKYEPEHHSDRTIFKSKYLADPVSNRGTTRDTASTEVEIDLRLKPLVIEHGTTALRSTPRSPQFKRRAATLVASVGGKSKTKKYASRYRYKSNKVNAKQTHTRGIKKRVISKRKK